MKAFYEVPECEMLTVRFEENILSNVERVTTISGDDAGSWDED